MCTNFCIYLRWGHGGYLGPCSIHHAGFPRVLTTFEVARLGEDVDLERSRSSNVPAEVPRAAFMCLLSCWCPRLCDLFYRKEQSLLKPVLCDAPPPSCLQPPGPDAPVNLVRHDSTISVHIIFMCQAFATTVPAFIGVQVLPADRLVLSRRPTRHPWIRESFTDWFQA